MTPMKRGLLLLRPTAAPAPTARPKDDPDEKGIVTGGDHPPDLRVESPKDDPDEKGIVTLVESPHRGQLAPVRKMTPMKRGLLLAADLHARRQSFQSER